MAFDAGELIAQLRLDRDPFQRSAKEAIAEGEALSKERFDMTVGLNQAPLDAGIAEAEAKAQSIGPVEVPVTVSDQMGPGMAAVEAQKAALSEPVTIGVTYDAQIRTVLDQGFSHQDATDFLQLLGLGPKQAQSALTDYLDRVAQQNAGERSSTLAQAMADAIMPTSDQFGRAYQDAFYRMVGAGGARGATPTSWQFYRGPLALPAAGDTSSGPFPNWSPAPESSYPGWGGLGAVLAAGGAGSGGGGILGAAGIGGADAAGGGGGGTGFLGQVAKITEEGRLYRAMGLGANAAGGLALATPMLLSFASALMVGAVGMTALGVATAPTVAAIQQGVSAVNQARDAVANAVPGTTQWSQALSGVASAWASINPGLQGAVQQITNLMSSGSPMGRQLQGFVTGDVSSVATWLHSAMGSGGAFAPFIYAAERAFNSIPGTFVKAMGWSSGASGVGSLVSFLAHDIGPAITGLTQLGAQFVRIGVAIAHFGEGGQGMQVLVQGAKLLADVLSSPAVRGFFTGFLEVDRAVLSIVAGALRLTGILSSKALGEGLGAVATAAGIAYAVRRVGRIGAAAVGRGGAGSAATGAEGAAVGSAAGAEGAALGGGAAGAAGAGGEAAGAASSGPVGAVVAALIGAALGGRAIGDWLHRRFHMPAVHPLVPLEAAGRFGSHYLGGGIQWAADSLGHLFGFHGNLLGQSPFSPLTGAQRNAAAWSSYTALGVTNLGLAQTRAQIAYRDALFGRLPAPTEKASQIPFSVQSLMKAGEQIGGGLVAAIGGQGTLFSRMAASIPQTYATMIRNLQAHTSRLEAWSQEAMAALRRGVNPGLVADLANTVPRDLARLADASTAQIRSMDARWQENLTLQSALANMRGGILDVTNFIVARLNSTNPLIRQAALKIGIALQLPIPALLGAWGVALNRIALMIGATASQAAALMSHATSTPAQIYMHSAGIRGYGLSGHRAAGGPVSALSAYLVGEKGPEVFVPGQSGYIVPNQSFGGSSGGAPQVSVTFYIDATGATNPAATKQQVQQALDATWPKVRQAIKQGVGKIG